jgi:acetyltransferase-like isoleucine patch superfamily enzyme
MIWPMMVYCARMPPKSHGSGRFERGSLGRCPDSVVFEEGALVFHPENVFLDEDVYVGHYAILKGYYKNQLRVGPGTWIGQGAFLHAAGGIEIGAVVGIGPKVSILTSVHEDPGPGVPIMRGALQLRPVRLEDGCDIGVGTVILPGVTVGAGAQVGAGAVVTRDVPPGAVVAGNPARVLRHR